VDKFVSFIEDNEFDKSLMDDGKELQFLEFLIAQSLAFKKIESGKN